MAATDEMYLPSFEELTVPDINVSSPVLKAGARHLGLYCENQCNEFMLCLRENGFDHRICLNEGKEVTRCGLQFFQKLKKHCYEDFTKYWQCVDRSGNDMQYWRCKRQQAAYDQCVFESLGQKNREPGYFAKVKIYDSKRPKPAAKDESYPVEAPGLELPPDGIDAVPDPPELRYANRKPFRFG